MKRRVDETIPLQTLEETSAVLRMLAHPHRLAICDRLLRRSMSVGELAAELGLAHNAVSQHLNAMRAYGVVVAHRRGRQVHYRVVHPSAKWLLGCIRRHGCRE